MTGIRHRIAPIAIAAAGLTLAAPPVPATADTAAARRLDFATVVELARKGPRARAADARVEAARGQRTQARGTAFPSVEVTTLFGPSPDIKCSDNADCSTSLVTNNAEVNVDLASVFFRIEGTIIQPLWTFGKIDAVRSAADHAVRAAEHLRDQLDSDIEVEAARAYFGLKLARELRWTLEDGKEEIEKALVEINEKLDEGSPDVTLPDRFRVETLAAEVEARLGEARKTEAIALAGIRALVGDDRVDIDEEELAALEVELGDQGAYVQQAQSRRPDLRAAREGAAAAADLADLEHSRLFPDLVLLTGFRFSRAGGVDNPQSAFANDPFNATSLGAGLALRWNLNPYMQVGRTEQVDAEARRADALVDAAQKGASLEVRQAFNEAQVARQQLETAQKGARSARAWVASVMQAEAIGTIDSKDLADAYVAFFQARARLLSTTYEWNIATVRLRRATGTR